LPFQSALLNHPRFISGDFHTGFIAEYFPQGYQSAEGIHPQPDFMLALAAAVHRRLLERATGISGQLPGHEFQIGSDFVVCRLQASEPAVATPVHVQSDGELIRVTLNEQTHILRLFSNLRQLVVQGEFNGQPFCVQVERMGLNFRLTHQGVVVDTRVLSPSAARLSALMPIKQPPDLSKFLLSPMPGLLAEIAVQPGQTVQPGEKLAVIEAMKMENLLLAETEVVVDKVLASPGESLAVDQPILSFK
jgi:propionyl-CoA carboxylase alpha chain